ncbi:MAG: SusC/RagA family TonB-linked outer membrane protein [Bacteroidales bacterium]
MKKSRLLLSFFLFFTFQSFAQVQISGKVTNAETGESIPGVSIVVQEHLTVGTATDAEGNYTLDDIPEDAEALMFSYVGMETHLEPIDGRTTINVELTPTVRDMEGVVITGYGTTRSDAFTGSSSSVGAEKLEKSNMESIDQLLQGNIAGLQSVSVSGTPGSGQQIRIRGIGSINASNEPLVVIDGVPVVSGDPTRRSTSGNILSNLNPSDIQDVTVLKGAGSTAIYGARGANGVIVITTKSGKAGTTKFNFNAEYGYNDLAIDGPNTLNAEEWEELQIEGLENTFGIDDPSLVGLPVWDGETDTDWSDAILRDQARQQSYNFSSSGGTDRSSYYFSGSYDEKQGKVDATGFERYSGMMRLSNRPTDKISINLSTNASHSEQSTVYDGGSFRNPMMARHFLLPIDPVYDDDGEYWWDPSTNRMTNSLFNVPYIQQHDFADTKNSKVTGSVNVGWRPMKDLKLTSKLGLDYFGIEEPEYWNPTHGDGYSYQGIAWAYYTRNFNMVWQNMADYGLSIDDHRLDFKLVQESQKNKRYTISSNAERVASMDLTNLASFASPQIASSAQTDWASASIMFNTRYGFRETYFFEGTFRNEGHSRFSDENKYGNFWSVGAAWVLSNENFMDNVEFINHLKLNTSYGVNGNAGLPGERLYRAEFSYSGSYNDYPVITYTGIENQDLTWELNKTFNLGLDVELLESRLNASIERFTRTTEDMLLYLPLSRTTGFSGKWYNVGSMENSGFEVSLNTVNINGNGFDSFRWTTTLNYANITNEVVELADDIDEIIEGTKRISVGNHVNTYYMRKWAGVDSETGDPLWYINGKDGETTSDYSEAERAHQGTSVPEFTGGISNTIAWQGFSLDFQFNFSLNYKVYDTWAGYLLSDGRNYMFYNQYEEALDRWQEPGDETDVPRIEMGGNNNSYQLSTRYLYEASHIRLRNLVLNYNLPKSVTNPMGMDQVRVFVRGTNIWTYMFNDDLKWDPETDETGLIDMETPILKTYTFGVNLSF